ncbi:hypothetical protein B0H14DRAFT_2661898 [Mycena olivaceomarginata]|nr:hypothetical protein B0H14DRAFT_2661898 [Mycena olivaceomarginata]
MGLTLWLVPSAADSERLKKIMAPPESYLTSQTSYPKFEPHITLTSIPEPSPSLDAIVSSIPDAQPALPVAFDTVQLHRHVHEKLGIAPKTPKYPHISLCYINDDDAASGERDKYFQALEKSGKIRKDGSNVSLNCGKPGEEDWLSGFDSPEIWLARCEGPVETWTIVKKMVLPSL